MAQHKPFREGTGQSTSVDLSALAATSADHTSDVVITSCSQQTGLATTSGCVTLCDERGGPCSSPFLSDAWEGSGALPCAAGAFTRGGASWGGAHPWGLPQKGGGEEELDCLWVREWDTGCSWFLPSVGRNNRRYYRAAHDTRLRIPSSLAPTPKPRGPG